MGLSDLQRFGVKRRRVGCARRLEGKDECDLFLAIYRSGSSFHPATMLSEVVMGSAFRKPLLTPSGFLGARWVTGCSVTFKKAIHFIPSVSLV